MSYRPRDVVLTALSISFFLIAMQAQYQLASIMAVGNDIMINTANGKGRVVVDGEQDLKGLFEKISSLEVCCLLLGSSFV
jgi:hypothetical protein